MPILRVKAADGQWYDIPCIIGKDGYTPVKGVDYFDGEDGYTPVKGVDYWTEADKTEIKNSVLSSVPSASVDNAGIVQLSDSVTSASSTTGATSAAVKTAYDRAGGLLRRVIKKFENVQIPYFGYAFLGNMSDFGLDSTTDFIVSVTIRGWSSGETGKGCISVVKNSSGDAVYVMGSDECTFSSITVELWYTKLTPQS